MDFAPRATSPHPTPPRACGCGTDRSRRPPPCGRHGRELRIGPVPDRRFYIMPGPAGPSSASAARSASRSARSVLAICRHGPVFRSQREGQADGRHRAVDVQVFASVAPVPDLAQGRVGGLVVLDLEDVQVRTHAHLVVGTPAPRRLLRLRRIRRLSKQRLHEDVAGGLAPQVLVGPAQDKGFQAFGKAIHVVPDQTGVQAVDQEGPRLRDPERTTPRKRRGTRMPPLRGWGTRCADRRCRDSRTRCSSPCPA